MPYMSIGEFGDGLFLIVRVGRRGEFLVNVVKDAGFDFRLRLGLFRPTFERGDEFADGGEEACGPQASMRPSMISCSSPIRDCPRSSATARRVPTPCINRMSPAG